MEDFERDAICIESESNEPRLHKAIEDNGRLLDLSGKGEWVWNEDIMEYLYKEEDDEGI